MFLTLKNLKKNKKRRKNYLKFLYFILIINFKLRQGHKYIYLF